jgi:hypothetical protein
MKLLLKKYWWLLLLAIIVLSYKFFPDKLPYIPFSYKLQKQPDTIADRATHDPLTEINKIDIKESSLKGFVPAIQVAYHVTAIKELPLIDGEAYEPRVSSDGSKILFVIKSGNRSKLTMANLPSGAISQVNLTDFDVVMNPAWNVDGTKIVFVGIKGSLQEIYTYDLANQKLTQITKASQRKPRWPRLSPYTFDNHYRIIYVSEERGRKDIWWIRENGEDDRPITIPPGRVQEFMNPDRWKMYDEVPKAYSTNGGDFPEWSPSGDLIVYKSKAGNNEALQYSWHAWWHPATDKRNRRRELSLPSTKGQLLWSPNQSSFISYDMADHSASFIPGDDSGVKKVALNKILTSAPAFFPDGKGVAYTYKKDGKSVLAIEPLDDPLGDVSNLWLYKFQKSDWNKLAANHLQFKQMKYQQIYDLYESELYQQCDVPAGSDHRRPYLVTSDAVLETFYASFSALLGYVEREEFKTAIIDFSLKGLEAARAKKAPKEIEQLFLTGLALVQPDAVKEYPIEVKSEIDKIKGATGKGFSLFGKELNYPDFLIRGKYERDTDLQGYFQALKWYQVFMFDLEKPEDRKFVSTLLDVVQTPNVYASIERIHSTLKSIIGESRYYGPVTLKSIPEGGKLPEVETELPWVSVGGAFNLLPFIYTMDAFIFDELITHIKRPDTVGTIQNARVLPYGMDIMAAFGSQEAKKILVDEFKENKYENYVKKLDQVTAQIAQYPDSVWNRNLYNSWLGLTKMLMQEPAATAPEFTKTIAWKRKNLNTALGSWVNLRYETVAYVEQVGAECGESGYELMNIGYPRGYVEPNPAFFDKLDAAFGKIADRFAATIKEDQLRSAVTDRIAKYRKHIKNLAAIAQKEIDNRVLTDDDYAEIYYIGRTVEHFTLIMNSLSPLGNGLSKPDPIMKVVDVQHFNSQTLYEALGYANEIDVIVPYFGRRQVVKGAVYSYYEFRSSDTWLNDKWRQDITSHGPTSQRAFPTWIKDYY